MKGLEGGIWGKKKKKGKRRRHKKPFWMFGGLLDWMQLSVSYEMAFMRDWVTCQGFGQCTEYRGEGWSF